MGDKVRVKAIPCEVYSRVVGYFRPVQNWNDGKKEEFKERRYLDLSGLGLGDDHRTALVPGGLAGGRERG